jgi:hypothetical protein
MPRKRRNPLVQEASDLLKVYNTDPLGWATGYNPSSYDSLYGHNFPIFDLPMVPTMMRDSRVRFGLSLIKGPIQTFTVFLDKETADDGAIHETIREQGIQFPYVVECDDKNNRKYITDTLEKFWTNGLNEVLAAIEWGFSCCQVIYYKDADNKLDYDSMEFINPFQVRPVLRNGALIGIRRRGVAGEDNEGVFMPIPKIIWHVHNRQHHRIKGQSRLEWCHVPWHETWVQYGARDIRRTWFHRNSYDGGTMRYPIGNTKIPGTNQQVDNLTLALRMMSRIRTGGFVVLPDDLNSQGKPRWEYTPPQSNVTPQGLMEYPEQLRLEILEGLGIPPEVVESSSDGGFGSATGRKVPMIAYYSTLSPLVNNVIVDFCRYVLDYLLLIRNGKKVKYKVRRLVPLKSSLQNPGGPGGGARSDTVTSTESDSGLSA